MLDVFDGNPLAISQAEPSMAGLDPQIRQSDFLQSTQDLMFNEYGANTSVAINQNGVLQQGTIEDIYSRAQMNHGNPEKLYLDPLTHSAYNKIAFAKERIMLAGSPQNATGASLKEQWVAGGAISIESSRFLSGKTKPARPRLNTPGAPTQTNAKQQVRLRSMLVKYINTWLLRLVMPVKVFLQQLHRLRSQLQATKSISLSLPQVLV